MEALLPIRYKQVVQLDDDDDEQQPLVVGESQKKKQQQQQATTTTQELLDRRDNELFRISGDSLCRILALPYRRVLFGRQKHNSTIDPTIQLSQLTQDSNAVKENALDPMAIKQAQQRAVLMELSKRLDDLEDRQEEQQQQQQHVR